VRKVCSIITLFGKEFPRLYFLINCRNSRGPSFLAFAPSSISAAATKCWSFSLSEELLFIDVFVIVIYLTLILPSKRFNEVKKAYFSASA